MANGSIIIFCAHSDDAEIGCGGTILKYRDERKNIIHVVFSYGEKSHPHLKEKVIAKQRKKETYKIDKLIGRKSIFLGLKEGKFKESYDKTKKKVIEIIKKNRPTKIYTLSSMDPHPDHRTVNAIVVDAINEANYKGDVYAFEVWNIINENKPVVYVDITGKFNEKIRILKSFKSQWLSIYIQLLPIIFRARIYGNKNNCRYAEKFYKIR